MSSMTYQNPMALDLALPWQGDKEQEERFKRWLKRLLIPLLLLFIVIPWLPVFEKELEEREIEIVKTKIVLEPIIEEPVSTPVPEVQKPEPKPKPKPKPKPQPQQAAKPKADKPAAPAKPRNIAEEQGLTKISSQLDSLRQSLDLTKLQKKNVSTSKGGQIARADTTVLGSDRLTQKSEGIVVDESLMRSESTALAMHESTKLDGFVEGGAPGSDGDAFYSDIKGQRSVESIRRVLESGKSRAYMFYLRELRDRPNLSGTVVFELLIEPNGKISELKLVSSELNSPDLESKILGSVRQLNFGAEDVSPKRLKYKFNFLPS